MDKRRNWSNSWRIALNGIKKNLVSPRFYTVMAVAVIFLWTQVSGIRRYAAEQGLGVSPWYFPILFSVSLCVLFLYFGLVLLFCNAPFVDGQQMFVILRSGKKTWFLGQILYIVLSSVGYFTYLFLLSIVMYLPHVGITNEWGTVLKEIVRHPSLTDGGGISIEERTLTMFSPVEGCLLIWVVNVLVGCFLGLLIFYVNLYKSRTYGSAVALMAVVISNIERFSGDYANKLQYICPVTWTDLSKYARKQSPLSPVYTIGVLLAGSIILSLLIMRRSKKYSIEALEDL